MNEQKEREETVTLDILLEAFNAIKELRNEKFELSVTKKLQKLYKWLNPYIADFGSKQTKLLQQLNATPSTEGPGLYNIPPENRGLYVETVSKWLAQTIPIPENLKLSVSDFEGVEISLATLQSLDCVLQMEE